MAQPGRHFRGLFSPTETVSAESERLSRAGRAYRELRDTIIELDRLTQKVAASPELDEVIRLTDPSVMQADLQQDIDRLYGLPSEEELAPMMQEVMKMYLPMAGGQ